MCQTGWKTLVSQVYLMNLELNKLVFVPHVVFFFVFRVQPLVNEMCACRKGQVVAEQPPAGR